MVFLISGVPVVSVLLDVEMSNEDAKPAINYPFCFQYRFPPVKGSVENVVVSFEVFATFSLDRLLNDVLARCAGIFLEFNADHCERDESHLSLAA